MMTFLWLALGCGASPEVTQRWVLDRDEAGNYALVAVEIPSLDDAGRLIGPVGHGYRGGVLDANGYQAGGALDIAWVEHEGAGLALDADGLILWSFYYQLASTWEQLDALGYPGPNQSVSIAYNPVSVMDFQAAENAAYALSSHAFLLFPDMLETGVPLAANAGIVRHEFGHAWLHMLLTGDPEALPPWSEDELVVMNGAKAIHEGFADSTATLLLDDPTFIEASLSMPARDVRGDWVAEDALYPDPDASLLDLYDPYPLGTVFAAFAWDLREASDPATALDVVVQAATAWGEAGDWSHVDGYALLLAEIAAENPVLRETACASLAARFPHVEEPPSCSP